MIISDSEDIEPEISDESDGFEPEESMDLNSEDADNALSDEDKDEDLAGLRFEDLLENVNLEDFSDEEDEKEEK